MSGSVVAVVAHPDDESLIAGGTLALASQAGLRTGVVSLTRGELGPISSPALATPERLGTVRAGELEQAAAALGLDWVRCLSCPDGELPWVDFASVASELALMLKPHHPDIVLTFGSDGLYGHPDHVAAAEIAKLAAGCLEEPAEVYEAVWPRGLMAELAGAAAARGLPGGLWGLEPEAFGTDRDPIVTLDIRPVLERKLAGLRAHRTQLGGNHLLASLPPDLSERYLGEERWAGASARLMELLAGA